MAANLEDIVATSIIGMKFECVSVERLSGGLLRIVIDRCSNHPGSDRGVTIEDCELCLRHLQYVLSVEGVGYHRLEVSSPGLDRPLKSLADFERFIGFPVFIQTKVPMENRSGRKNFRGTLMSVVDGRIHLQLDAMKRSMLSKKRLESQSQSKLFFKKGEHIKIGQEDDLSNSMVEFQLSEIRSACLIPQIEFRKQKK